MIQDPGHSTWEIAIWACISEIVARLTIVNQQESASLEGLCLAVASHVESKSEIHKLRENLTSISAQMRSSQYWGLILDESITSLTELCNHLKVEFTTLKRDFRLLYGEVQKHKSRMGPPETGISTALDM